MDKRFIINKMMLLASIASCALLFSCKSDKETENAYGKTIEFVESKGDIIKSNSPSTLDVKELSSYHSNILHFAYAIAKTDNEANESHNVKVKYGIGETLYKHIKYYENKVDSYDKAQKMKLTIYRISFANEECYLLGNNIITYPYEERDLSSYELQRTNKPASSKLSDCYKRDVIYTETNELGYYFSEDFLYGNLEIDDLISKDDLMPYEPTNDAIREYGILQYYYVLEPLDENDEIIKFARKSDYEGMYDVATKDGYEVISWNQGDYVFPLGEENYMYKNEHNSPVLRLFTSYVNSEIKYVIEGNNVTFYTYKEAA